MNMTVELVEDPEIIEEFPPELRTARGALYMREFVFKTLFPEQKEFPESVHGLYFSPTLGTPPGFSVQEQTHVQMALISPEGDPLLAIEPELLRLTLYRLYEKVYPNVLENLNFLIDTQGPIRLGDYIGLGYAMFMPPSVEESS